MHCSLAIRNLRSSRSHLNFIMDITMKRLLFPLALALASTTVSAATETGRIDFTGYIYAGGTCPIEVVEPGMGVLPSVSMGNFLPKHFPVVGTTSPERLSHCALRPTRLVRPAPKPRSLLKLCMA